MRDQVSSKDRAKLQGCTAVVIFTYHTQSLSFYTVKKNAKDFELQDKRKIFSPLLVSFEVVFICCQYCKFFDNKRNYSYSKME